MKSIVLALFISLSFAQGIHKAVSENDIKSISNILLENPTVINSKNNNGQAPLHIAVEKAYEEIVKLLIDAGANIEIKDWESNTPIHYAAHLNNIKMVKLLFDNGADVTSSDYQLFSTIHFAARSGGLEILNYLKSKGADLNQLAENKVNILQVAAGAGDTEILAFLIENDFDINYKNLFNKTALHTAAARGKLEAVKFLIGEKAELNIRGLDGRTAYNEAVLFDHSEIADLLINEGADTSDRILPEMKGKYFGQKPPGTTPEIFAPGIVSTEDFEFAGTFSPDYNYYCFTRRGNYHKHKTNTLVLAQRNDNKWSEPEWFEFSGEIFDYEPAFSPSGDELLFGSRRKQHGDEKFEGARVWKSVVENGNLTEPVILPSPFDTLRIMYPVTCNSGNIYVTTFTPDWKSRITIIKKEGDKYLPPEILPETINFCHSVAHPYVAPDESYMIFDAQPNAPVSYENKLYVSFKLDNGQWSSAIELPESVNKSPNLMCASISPDGKYLFYAEGGNIFWVNSVIVFELKNKLGLGGRNESH